MQNNFNLNASGYDLFEITKDEWILNVRGGALFTGTLRTVVLHCVKSLGFKLSEIEVALFEMHKNDHNGAHFGVYKGFIFSFQKDFKYERKAS